MVNLWIIHICSPSLAPHDPEQNSGMPKTPRKKRKRADASDRPERPGWLMSI